MHDFFSFPPSPVSLLPKMHEFPFLALLASTTAFTIWSKNAKTGPPFFSSLWLLNSVLAVEVSLQVPGTQSFLIQHKTLFLGHLARLPFTVEGRQTNLLCLYYWAEGRVMPGHGWPGDSRLADVDQPPLPHVECRLGLPSSLCYSFSLSLATNNELSLGLFCCQFVFCFLCMLSSSFNLQATVTLYRIKILKVYQSTLPQILR